jgi:hypothetical protein
MDAPYTCFIAVTGEANFKMNTTRLTIGGFTQPGVARNLMELPSNAEKGLSHRYMHLLLHKDACPVNGVLKMLSSIPQSHKHS